jgi:hypothetical protein
MRSERARSQTPPVPPRTVYSHRLLAPPPPTNLHRLLFHLLHDLLPWSTGAVFWHHLLLPSTRTASSRLLLAPSLPAASSRRPWNLICRVLQKDNTTSRVNPFAPDGPSWPRCEYLEISPKDLYSVSANI